MLDQGDFRDTKRIPIIKYGVPGISPEFQEFTGIYPEFRNLPSGVPGIYPSVALRY